MKKVYEIFSTNLFDKRKNARHEFLVSGDEREIAKVCEKMGEFSSSAIKDFYDFQPVEFEINDNTNEMYIVHSVNKNAVNDYDIEYNRLDTVSFVNCERKRLDEIIEKYNNSSENYELQVEKTKVLNVDEVYDAFNERLKNLNVNYRISNDTMNESNENILEL